MLRASHWIVRGQKSGCSAKARGQYAPTFRIARSNHGSLKHKLTHAVNMEATAAWDKRRGMAERGPPALGRRAHGKVRHN